MQTSKGADPLQLACKLISSQCCTQFLPVVAKPEIGAVMGIY